MLKKNVNEASVAQFFNCQCSAAVSNSSRPEASITHEQKDDFIVTMNQKNTAPRNNKLSKKESSMIQYCTILAV